MGRGPGIRAASESSIQIDFRYNGRRFRERIALAPSPANLKYAARLKATIEHEIAKNEFDYAKHFPNSKRLQSIQASGTGFRTAVLAYIDSLVGQLEPETLDEYRRASELVAEGIGANIPIASIKRKDFRKWVASLDISKKRIDNMLIATRGMFAQAVEDEEIDSSPLSEFKVRRVSVVESDDPDPFTPTEVESLAAQQGGDLWAFWAWSGLRSGEIIGARWDSLSPDRKCLTIERAVRRNREKGPKTESGRRVIELLPAARAAVGRIDRAPDEPHIFRNPTTGKRWGNDKTIRRAFAKACKAAGVRYRNPYQLRHTFASWALSSGENPAWAAKYMGHKDLIMFFKIYAKWMPTLDPKAGSKMAKATKSKAA